MAVAVSLTDEYWEHTSGATLQLQYGINLCAKFFVFLLLIY